MWSFDRVFWLMSQRKNEGLVVLLVIIAIIWLADCKGSVSAEFTTVLTLSHKYKALSRMNLWHKGSWIKAIYSAFVEFLKLKLAIIEPFLEVIKVYLIQQTVILCHYGLWSIFQTEEPIETLLFLVQFDFVTWLLSVIVEIWNKSVDFCYNLYELRGSLGPLIIHETWKCIDDLRYLCFKRVHWCYGFSKEFEDRISINADILT